MRCAAHPVFRHQRSVFRLTEQHVLPVYFSEPSPLSVMSPSVMTGPGRPAIVNPPIGAPER